MPPLVPARTLFCSYQAPHFDPGVDQGTVGEDFLNPFQWCAYLLWIQSVQGDMAPGSQPLVARLSTLTI